MHGSVSFVQLSTVLYKKSDKLKLCSLSKSEIKQNIGHCYKAKCKIKVEQWASNFTAVRSNPGNVSIRNCMQACITTQCNVARVPDLALRARLSKSCKQVIESHFFNFAGKESNATERMLCQRLFQDETSAKEKVMWTHNICAETSQLYISAKAERSAIFVQLVQNTKIFTKTQIIYVIASNQYKIRYFDSY